MPDKYIWDKESGPEFQTTLASIPFQDKIKSFLNQSFENSDMMVDSLNSIICQAADISIKKVRYTDKNIKSKQNKKQNKLKWFDQSLVGLRRQLEQKQKLLDKYRRDPQIRGSFFSLLKKHRKARKLKYKEYKKNLFDQLDLLRDSDPKSYWSLLEKLNHLDKPSSSSPSDEIPEEEWFRYFKSLNKNNKNVDFIFK